MSLRETPRMAAERQWRENCPEFADEDGVLLARERASSGEVRAIECRILFHRAQTTPYTEDEVEYWTEILGAPPEDETAEYLELLEAEIFELLYGKWRLTGEGLEEAEAQARLLTKAEIDDALLLSQFDPGLLPPRKADDCGRTAQDDPGFRFVMMGRGEREPPSCGPAVMDGTGAG